jgi:hypothetical protein
MRKDGHIDLPVRIMFSGFFMLIITAFTAGLWWILSGITGVLTWSLVTLHWSSAAISVVESLIAVSILIVVGWLCSSICANRYISAIGIMEGQRSKEIRKASRVYIGSLFFVVCVSQLGIGASFYQASASVFGEKYKAIHSARRYPVSLTVNRCSPQETKIYCVVTLRPQKYQDYVLIGDWSSRVEQGLLSSGKIPVLGSANWHPVQADSRHISIVELDAMRPLDLEIEASKSEICNLARIWSAHEVDTAISFEVFARTNELSRTDRDRIRMRPDNEKVLREEVESACLT